MGKVDKHRPFLNFSEIPDKKKQEQIIIRRRNNRYENKEYAGNGRLLESEWEKTLSKN